MLCWALPGRWNQHGREEGGLSQATGMESGEGFNQVQGQDGGKHGNGAGEGVGFIGEGSRIQGMTEPTTNLDLLQDIPLKKWFQ